MSTRRLVYPDASRETAAALSGERLARLEEVAELDIHIGSPASDAEFAARIGDADAMILGWGLPVKVMREAPNLELIAFTGIGAGNFVDLEEAAKRGITVCNTPGYADHAVAEHALAMMLAVARNLARLDRDLRRGQWNQSLPGLELRGKTLGLVGFGGIGAHLAELARGIGMKVRAWTRKPSAERARRHRMEFTDLESLLRESDVISVHTALTEETRNLLDAKALACTRPGVLLVNTARGEIIDENALIEALRSGHIAGAGIDVFHTEPLPTDNPLIGLDNVLLTPHVAFNTPQATLAILDISIDNVVRYFRGDPANVVAAT